MKHLSLITLAMLISIVTFASITPLSPSSGTVCIGSGGLWVTDSLSPGGTWSSSNPSIATVSGGYVTGLSAGTVTISYVTSGGTATGVYTIAAAPGSIYGGPTQFCVGSGGTLTDATPGGTWSSGDASIATVDISTGTVTGTGGGYVYIYYTLPTGCSSVMMDTVNATTAPILTGPTTVCVGSTITLTDSAGGLLGGTGTWTASNGNATVGSSGDVTGVSTGTVTISLEATGTCGPAYGTLVVTVGGVPMGTVYGAGSVTIGSTGNYYITSGPSGGTWSINPTTVATVDPTTGVVTGIALGSASVTYTASSCGTPVSASTSLTVVSLDGISGNVLFSSAYYGPLKIWLITYNPSTLDLEAYDSISVYASGTSQYYQFTGIPTDSFRVKAAVNDSSSVLTGFIPTYHGSFYYWHDADVIYHTSGSSDLNENITMLSGTPTTGPGFIGGNVTTGANKGTSAGIPVTGLHMVALNTSTSTIAQMTYTDGTGAYSFSNLPYGTYTVFPDSVNYVTTAATGITLSSSNPSLSGAGFIQHTVSKTITPLPLATPVAAAFVPSIAAFPNPTSGKLTIQWNEKTAEKGTISITDITGREVYRTTIAMQAGSGATAIDLAGLTNGLYMINVKSASLNFNNKIQVQH